MSLQTLDADQRRRCAAFDLTDDDLNALAAYRARVQQRLPALLDALPDEAVPDVVFCYRDPEDGSSRLVRLDDLPTYPELVAQGSLGDLATSGALERAAKIRIDEATRRSLALAWMDRLG